MARKKEPDIPKGTPAWMATFSDLMNLLLCFFVLLFSMSTVDAEKWEQVVNSMTSNFSIFDSGSVGINDGELISNGVSQLENIGDELNDEGNSDESNDKSEASSVDSAKDILMEEQKKETEEMYEKISGLIDKNKIDQYVSVGIDDNYQYVKISMYGAVLFDSGKAEIKKDSYSVLNKVGQILKLYDKQLIKIQGHTDNVPMSDTSTYENNFQLSTARANAVAEYVMDECNLKGKNIEPSGRGEYEPATDNSTPEGRAKNRRVEFKIYNELSNEG
ncbi:MAG: flagellar motor protein MotB [bacterium]|nr:flagellar motor protein MotB [bacterium]